jgi:hypothetical protein
MSVQTLDALSGDTVDPDTGKVQGSTLPDPSRYVATVIVFAMLAAAAMFESTAKLAAAFGGVAAVAIVVAPGAGGKTPPVVGALAWFNRMITGGSVAAPVSATPPTNATAAAPQT